MGKFNGTSHSELNNVIYCTRNWINDDDQKWRKDSTTFPRPYMYKIRGNVRDCVV